MENTNHSGNQRETSKNNLVYVSPLALNHLEGNLGFHRTDRKFLADFFIDYKNEKIHIKDRDGDEFFVDNRNLSLFLKKFSVAIKSTKKNEKKEKKGFKNNLTTNTELKELNEIFKKSKRISLFCQSLLNSQFFKNYKSIHLFLHKKGSAFSRHLHVQDNLINESTESIIEFSTLFQAVKKSKNRSFGQATLKASNHKIIGTCIAEQYSLLNHNLVFVFSNDDFLPQTNEAIESFNRIKNYLKVYFELLLNTEFNDHQKELIRNTIDTLINLSGQSNEFEKLKAGSQTDKGHIDFDLVIKKIKERFFDHVDINLVERIALLGELLNTLQHELSNPLFGLQLSSEILLQDDLDSDQKLFIENINKSIKRSQSILKNFSGLYQKNITKEKINLFTLIEEVMTLTKSESRNIRKKILIENSTKEYYSIETNQTWLAQIIFNLVINSSQALNSNNISDPLITISLSHSISEFVITIKDNGPGVPKTLQQKIFDPFYTTKKEGNGLGLAISSKLAQKLGGELSYIALEQGACFKLRLPV